MMDMTSQLNLQKHEVILETKVHDGEERLAIMSETMRTVAHEWRQPLNAISLDAQGLLFDLDFDDDVPKERITESLENISKSTQALSSIIENFQGVTDLKGSKKKRNIKEIVQEGLKISELNEKAFVNEEHETSASFRTYPRELALALSSILTNAREFTKELEDKVITIVTRQKNENVVCEISNNGVHIPEEIITQIFTPYFSTKTEKNGVGLSLYTCKVIIELHLKGFMIVSNVDENIVKFTLTFPMKALES
jgi:signal transduction histidine kinase